MTSDVPVFYYQKTPFELNKGKMDPIVTTDLTVEGIFVWDFNISSTKQGMVGGGTRQADLQRIWGEMQIESHWKVSSSTHDGSRTYMKGLGDGEDGWDLLWIVLELMDPEGWDALLEEAGQEQ